MTNLVILQRDTIDNMDDEEISVSDLVATPVSSSQQQHAKKNPPPPAEMICPVTHHLLVDPVIVKASCHHTVSRMCFYEWLADGNKTCPACQAPLTALYAKANVPLQRAIDHYREKTTGGGANAAATDDMVLLSHSSSLSDLSLSMSRIRSRHENRQEDSDGTTGQASLEEPGVVLIRHYPTAPTKITPQTPTPSPITTPTPSSTTTRPMIRHVKVVATSSRPVSPRGKGGEAKGQGAVGGLGPLRQLLHQVHDKVHTRHQPLSRTTKTVPTVSVRVPLVFGSKMTSST